MADRWTKEMDGLLIARRCAGRSFRQIADEFQEAGLNISKNACIGRWRRLVQAGVAAGAKGQYASRKNWTAAEERYLLAYIKEGLMLKEIAVRLGRSLSAVKSKWEELRIKDPELADLRRQRKSAPKAPPRHKAKQKEEQPPVQIVYGDDEVESTWSMTPSERREVYTAVLAKFMYLSDRHHMPPGSEQCHFIIGEGDQWQYCRQPTEAGPYCPTHTKVCYHHEAE